MSQELSENSANLVSSSADTPSNDISSIYDENKRIDLNKEGNGKEDKCYREAPEKVPLGALEL